MYRTFNIMGSAVFGCAQHSIILVIYTEIAGP